MVVLTFIRHGETDFNKHNILQGHLNIPLNSNGRHESAVIGNRLSSQIDEFPVDLIISSDLDRASETALIIHQYLSIVSNQPIPVLQTPLLRERYLGKLEGVDLKQLVNWKELTEQSTQIVDIQKIISIRNLSLNSIFSKISSSPSKSDNNKYIQKITALINNTSLSSTTTTTASLNPTTNHINNSNNLSSDSLLSSSPTTLSWESTFSETSSCESSFSEITDEWTSSNSSSLSSSTSSLSSLDDLDHKFLINNSSCTTTSSSIYINTPHSTPSSPSSNLKLTSNILKHLPQKELKMESKSKLIKRAKDAFQYILKQIPSTYISPSTDNETTDFSTSQITPKKDFHIVIVSHNVMLRALTSLLLCKKSSNLLCKLTPSTQNTQPTPQSDSQSSRNFKWIQLEFKHNSLFRTSFNILEKKSTKNTFKRVPRNIQLLHYYSDQNSQPQPIKNIIETNVINNNVSNVSTTTTIITGTANSSEL